jgi:hypothetical protein
MQLEDSFFSQLPVLGSAAPHRSVLLHQPLLRSTNVSFSQPVSYLVATLGTCTRLHRCWWRSWATLPPLALLLTRRCPPLLRLLLQSAMAANPIISVLLFCFPPRAGRTSLFFFACLLLYQPQAIATAHPSMVAAVVCIDNGNGRACRANATSDSNNDDDI